MAIEITDLSTLDPSLVASQQAQLLARIQALVPQLDLRRGVFHDLLLYMEAVLASRTQVDLNRYLSARSLLDITTDPTLADTDIVDRVLSNFRVTRKPAIASTGSVTLVLTAPLTVTIGSGASFTASGQTYVTQAAYTAKSQQLQVNTATDRLLIPTNDGKWSFTIPLIAAVAGTAGNIPRNTAMTVMEPPATLSSCYAATDFSGGQDLETNAQLLTQLQQGLAAQVPANRVNMQAMLRADTMFANIIASSIIGFGDAEMLRDRHSIWPGSRGGRVDWYIRTQDQVTNTILTKTATLISNDGDGGVWQFNITRDDAPGFYEIASILPAGSTVTGTLALLSDTRAFDISGDYTPDIVNALEAAYSRYQTSVIQFRDTLTNYTGLAVGATASYTVTVKALSQIGLIQDYLSSFDLRALSTDLLIKAPIPCFLQINMTIFKKPTQADPDIPTIQAAVASEVNHTDFLGRLSASQVHEVVHKYLESGMSVGSVDLFGRIRQPDGINLFLRSNEAMVVPSVPAVMLGPRTVQFFVSPADVVINIVPSVSSPL